MVKRIINMFFNRKPRWRHQHMLDDGNLVVGKNCDLSKLVIIHQKLIPKKLNITIGDNCQLWGNLVLHDENSTISIGDRVFIGDNTTLNVKDEIVIGNDVLISWDCVLIDSNSHPLEWEYRKNDVEDWQKGPHTKDWSKVVTKRIVVGDKCWIGLRSIITKGVELGEGSIVASGSVVTKTTEPFTVVGGNPAQKLKDLRK